MSRSKGWGFVSPLVLLTALIAALYAVTERSLIGLMLMTGAVRRQMPLPQRPTIDPLLSCRMGEVKPSDGLR